VRHAPPRDRIRRPISPRIEVLARGDLAGRAAELLAKKLGTALVDSPRASLALSGGQTPAPVYEQLATKNLAWDHIEIFAVDERVVPEEDERSNWKMIRGTLLDPAGVPQARRHPIPTGDGDPEEAAAVYQQELCTVLGERPGFTACVLGVGPDGHTASLFPGSPQLSAAGLVAAGPAGLEPRVPRVTLTFRAINSSRLCIFLAEGDEKAGPVAAALAPAGEVERIPARGVQPDEGEVVWLLDEAAASRTQAPR
jgi:6-phosphogluconolactonase